MPRPDQPLIVAIVAEVSSSLRNSFADDPRFEVREHHCRSEAELIATAAGAAVLITRHHNRITTAVLDQLGELRVIGQATSGVDNITASAAERGIRILSTPGANANAVAEYVVGQLISLTRSLTFYDREVRTGVWSRDDCASRHELAAFTLGIVGIGHVGTRVASLASAFGMRVLAHDPYVDADEIHRRGATPVAELRQLLEQCDVLTLHAPLTSETHRMIGHDELMRLRPGSLLINAARGELLDLAAIVAAIESGHLAAAACDVFDPEPAVLPESLPASLRLTPHIAGCTSEAKEGAGVRLYTAVCGALQLEPIQKR